jgi:U4/U6.U5 tri-snRNP component SNU23
MSAAQKSNAYGTNTSDTSFRKTWDREEYAAKAAKREEKEREEGKARYEAKLEGRKYIPRATTPPDAKETESRAARLDVGANVGKTTFVPAGAAVGKRGRGAGFYCPDCDLTYKDNLQLVDHLNSKQHLSNVGQTGEVKKATLQDVKDRLAWLKERKEKERKEADATDLAQRLEAREQDDERKREEKRRKRREKRRRTDGGVGHEDFTIENNGIIC